MTNANGGSDFKYSNLSYEECADIIRKYVKAAPVEILKFFRMVVFNYLTLNDDAHLKNFSLINRGDGEYHLTPAYDLINTSLHLSMPRIFALEKGFFKEGMQLTDTRTVGRKDFEEFGRRIGWSARLVKRELDSFATEPPLAKELIDRSRAMSDLIGNYIEIQKTKIDSQRLNIEAQKVKVDTVRLLSENGSITAYEKYLGIEEPIPAIKG